MSDDAIDIVHIYIQQLSEEISHIDKDTDSMLEKLMKLEVRFSKKLKKTSAGKKVYMSFIDKISKTPGGIKMARPYFREREGTFLSTVNVAIRDLKPELMYDLAINHRFVAFAVECFPNKELVKLSEEINTLRNDIIVKNLHLALNRAKIFSRYGAEYRLGNTEFVDLIQLANEALILSVDKYVIDEESSSFRAMAIGRILANLIAFGSSLSSATIGAHSQKKLYQIKRYIQSNNQYTVPEMATALNIAETEINELMQATMSVRLDEPLYANEDNSELGISMLSGEEDVHGDVEKALVSEAIKGVYRVLSTIEKKVLRLKGVNYENS